MSTEPNPSSDDEAVCGETFDHDLEVVYEDDTLEQFVCRHCGAEIFAEYDPTDSSVSP